MWYPDSGAYHYVTNDLTTLQEATPYTDTNKIFMENGVTVSMAHTGSSIFTTANRVFHLNLVLHVPRICKNLMSVAKFATDNQVYFEFHPLHYFVKGIKTGSILLTGRMHNGLYQCDLSDSRQLGAGFSSATAHTVHLSYYYFIWWSCFLDFFFSFFCISSLRYQ